MSAYWTRAWESLPAMWRSRATLGALAFAIGALLLLSFHQVVRGAVQTAQERQAALAQQPAPEPTPEMIAEAETLVTVPQRVSLDSGNAPRARVAAIRWVP